MRVLVYLLPLVLAFLVGCYVGGAGRRRAVAASYAATVPVTQALRELAAADPLSPVWGVQKEIALTALQKYEGQMRSL